MRRAQLSFIIIAAIAFALAACGRFGQTSTVTADDMSLGNPAAKVTVIEYASASCPHCARFNNEVFPAFKAAFIDTGKIHYVFREMLVGQGPEIAVASAGFLLARCAGKDKYFAVTDAIFNSQQQAFEAPRETLLNVAKSVGMTDEGFNKCVNDDKAMQALQDRVDHHSRDDHVNSTPTFVINGKSLEPGYHSLEEIDAAIKAAGG